MKNEIKLIVAGALIAAGAAFALAAPVAENWENHCAKFHGADGKGQTKVGKKLAVKDYTVAAEQAKFTDAEAIKVTAEGFKDAAGKERMKGFKDELSAKEIEELVKHVRKFKK
jgi:cytochrome c6